MLMERMAPQGVRTMDRMDRMERIDPVREKLSELWRRIDAAHLGYLEADDSPDKLRQRRRLEAHADEYLALVPHAAKFFLQETGAAFAESARAEGFTAHRLARAWEAVARYAHNLLSQPWRKEYATVRAHSGHYQHEIEGAGLRGAAAVFKAMGYRPTPDGRAYELDGPVCPDRVEAVSRDSLIARQECRLMVRIWEEASPRGHRCAWSDIVRCRELYPGDVHRSVRALLQLSSDADIYSNVNHHNGHTPHDNGIYSNGQEYPIDDRFSPDERPAPRHHYAAPVHPPDRRPSRAHVAPALQFEGHIPTTGGHPYPMYFPTGPPAPYMNGYVYPTAVHPAYCPTAVVHHPVAPPAHERQRRPPAGPKHQENAVDHDYDNYENGRRNSAPRLSCESSGGRGRTPPPRSDTQPSLSKAREDGTGTFESWDYVYRKLEGHRGANDPDGGNAPTSPYDRDSKTPGRTGGRESKKYHRTTLDLEDAMREINLERNSDEEMFRTAKINETLMKKKQESDARAAKANLKKSSAADRERIQSYDSPSAFQELKVTDKTRLISKEEAKSKKEIDREIMSNINTSTDNRKNRKSIVKCLSSETERTLKKKTIDHPPAGSSKKNQLPQDTSGSSTHSHPANGDAVDHGLARLVVSLDNCESNNHTAKLEAPKKWQCSTCTYLNSATIKACEMCGKSKQPGPEVLPLTSGGKECPQCTFVNQRQANVCEVCGESLKNSPTYI